VARTGLFSRRATGEDAAEQAAAEQRAADEDRERGEDAPTAGERRRAAHRADAEQRAAESDRAAEGRVYTSGRAVGEPPVRAEPEAEPAPVVPVVRAHTSALAVLSLLVGLSATYAALSGRLAPVGVAAGVLGLLLAIGGSVAVRRTGVTGHGVALLGLLFSLAGLVLGILAVRHAAPWLDGRVDEVGRARDWLDARLTWLKRY